jgi:hypothetical protein
MATQDINLHRAGWIRFGTEFGEPYMTDLK